MPTPEDQARTRIDALMSQAGWTLQDPDAFNRNAALGVAVREFPLPSGPCDYLLFIDGKAGFEVPVRGNRIHVDFGKSQKPITVDKHPNPMSIQ